MCFKFFFQSCFAPFFFSNFPLASFLQLLQLYSCLCYGSTLILLLHLSWFCSCVYSNFAYVSILISFMHFYPIFTFVSFLQLHSYIYSNLICFYFSSLVSFLHQSFSFALAFVLTSLLQLKTFACFNFTLVFVLALFLHVCCLAITMFKYFLTCSCFTCVFA